MGEEGKAAGKAGTILMVDDDLALLKLLCRFLENAGYKVETANDGMEALIKVGQIRIDMAFFNTNQTNALGVAPHDRNIIYARTYQCAV